MTWKNEFGAGYEPPQELLDHERFTDTSWHNDACPSFMVVGCDNVWLYSQAVDPADRELPGAARFGVLVEGDPANPGVVWGQIDTVYDGDDLGEAIQAALTAAG